MSDQQFLREERVAHPRPVHMKEGMALEDFMSMREYRFFERTDLGRLARFLIAAPDVKPWASREAWGIAVWHKAASPVGCRIHWDFDHHGKLEATEAV